MGISRERFEVTVDATRGGTVTSASVVSGEIVEVRCQSTAWLAGGSADLTITRGEDGGTVLAATNVPEGPFTYSPRAAANSVTGGTTAYGAGQGPVYDGGVPVDGELRLVVLQAAANTAGTVNVYYRT